MKTTFKRLALVLLVTFSSCDNAKKMEYKYAESPKLLACDFPNGDLLKEAVYSFENDLSTIYRFPKTNLAKSYSTFILQRQRGKLNAKEIASEHSLNLAKALKKEAHLWSTVNTTPTLNSSDPLMDCIVNNIINDDIKRTYNALLSTNSLNPKLVLPLLNGTSRFVKSDGSLRTYVALELFYSQLLDTKLEELKNPNPQVQPEPAKPSVNSVNLNNTPKQVAPVKVEEKAPHAGHNH